MAINPNTTFSSGAILTAAQMNRLPWGITAYASKTANQLTIGPAATDITSLSISFTADSTRYYRTTLVIPYVSQNTSAGTSDCIIADGSNNIKNQSSMTIAAGEYAFYTVTLVETGISGSITRKARIATNAGTISVYCGSANPGFIFTEDIGQA